MTDAPRPKLPPPPALPRGPDATTLPPEGPTAVYDDLSAYVSGADAPPLPAEPVVTRAEYLATSSAFARRLGALESEVDRIDQRLTLHVNSLLGLEASLRKEVDGVRDQARELRGHLRKADEQLVSFGNKTATDVATIAEHATETRGIARRISLLSWAGGFVLVAVATHLRWLAEKAGELAALVAHWRHP